MFQFKTKNVEKNLRRDCEQVRKQKTCCVSVFYIVRLWAEMSAYNEHEKIQKKMIQLISQCFSYVAVLLFDRVIRESSSSSSLLAQQKHERLAKMCCLVEVVLKVSWFESAATNNIKDTRHPSLHAFRLDQLELRTLWLAMNLCHSNLRTKQFGKK